MTDCKEQVYSNDYYDFLLFYGDISFVAQPADCVQPIDEDYDILYYSRKGLQPLNLSAYTYAAIPNCYGLMDQTALEVSGILRMQNQPALGLKGNGVLMGFIDTGDGVPVLSGEAAPKERDSNVSKRGCCSRCETGKQQ